MTGLSLGSGSKMQKRSSATLGLGRIVKSRHNNSKTLSIFPSLDVKKNSFADGQAGVTVSSQK
jgi:hypothetical protein